MAMLNDNIDNGKPIRTGFEDDELELNSNNSRIGCHRQGCNHGYIEKSDGTMDYCICYLTEKLRIKFLKARIPEEYHNIKKLNTEGLKVARKMYSEDESNFRVVNDINKFLDNYKNNIKKIKEEGWNLFLEGPLGSGKTTAACIIGKHAIKNNYSVLFSELENLREIWTGQELTPDLKKLKEGIFDVDFLILDDIGQEFISNKSDHQLSKLDLLIRKRISKKLCTIFTSNSRNNQIEERYDKRINSLLKMRMVHILMNREVDIREENTSPNFLFEEESE